MEIDKYLEIGYEKNGYFRRKEFIKCSEFDEDDIMKKYGDTNIYSTLYSYNKETQDDSELYGPFYLDLDIDDIENKDNFDKIKKDLMLTITTLKMRYGIDEDMMNIYFSGSKGFHIYIPPTVFGIKRRKDLNVIYKAIATSIKNYTLYKTVDTKIYDNKRLIRLVGSKHGKTGLYKVEVELDFIKDLKDFDKLKEYASSKREKINKDIKQGKIDLAEKRFNNIINNLYKNKKEHKTVTIKKIDKLPDCILWILENGFEKGSRNNTVVVLASSLLQNGNSIEDTKDIILAWNDNNADSLSNREIVTTINSAYSLFLNGRGYGCNAIRDLGYCRKSCSLLK